MRTQQALGEGIKAPCSASLPILCQTLAPSQEGEWLDDHSLDTERSVPKCGAPGTHAGKERQTERGVQLRGRGPEGRGPGKKAKRNQAWWL